LALIADALLCGGGRQKATPTGGLKLSHMPHITAGPKWCLFVYCDHTVMKFERMWLA